ncbi:hypothetical protein GCM10011368_14680 [Hyunsoonleella pacifica]|nr:hypothetical protein GCM10011368_14680 [Hyunsoonleella pacifica]
MILTDLRKSDLLITSGVATSTRSELLSLSQEKNVTISNRFKKNVVDFTVYSLFIA